MKDLDQNILHAVDALLRTGPWDKLVLLTPAEALYPLLAPRVEIPVIVITQKGCTANEIPSAIRPGDSVITLPCEVSGIEDLLNLSVFMATASGALSRGDRVVVIGAGLEDRASLLVLLRNDEFSFSEFYRVVTDPSMPDPSVVKAVLTIALELGRMRRQPAGALYVIGDTDRVLQHSTPLFMNPFEGQPGDRRNVMEGRVRDTLKEYARLDGAVIIDEKGFVRAAGVHINADMRDVDVLIEGTRHAVAAAITHRTGAIAITVSEKTGMIMLFRGGSPILKVGP
ncbi:MAG: hypothetical protein HPY67_07920 [Syntrophaceae bacterium]|nr:hypothetical protein [Syntrophaceae bacterium]